MNKTCSADEATLRAKNIRKKGKLYDAPLLYQDYKNIMFTSGLLRTPKPKNWFWFKDEGY